MNESDVALRLLLAEDDPVSAGFLREALLALPARVDVAMDAAAAMALARQAGYHACLLDAHLPDASGIELLAALRSVHPRLPALAHTASREPQLHAALRDAGFAQVLVKPLPIRALHQAVRELLGSQASTPGAVARARWDDAAALSALGKPEHVAAMRALFRTELPAQRQRVADAFAAGNHEALAAELHRLSAACGFVGAARLADAVQALRGTPGQDAALQAFMDAAADVLACD